MEYNQVIQDFAQGWAHHLAFHLHNDFLLPFPEISPDQLTQAPILADELQPIARAAQVGAGDPEEVLEAINSLLQRQPPRRLLTVAFVWILARAEAWATGDRLLTQVHAAEETGKSFNQIANAVRVGKIRSFADPEAPNPRRDRVFVLLSEVVAL